MPLSTNVYQISRRILSIEFTLKQTTFSLSSQELIFDNGFSFMNK